MTEAIARRAIGLRQTKSISLGDSLIAGTALEHELGLVTRNAKDFARIDNLTVVDPIRDV
jgi:hypothetical protein